MDPIEILGSILGQKANGSGAGAEILKEIFGTGRRQEAPRSGPGTATRSPSASRSREFADEDIDRQARELEDLLNVAKERSAAPRTAGQRAPAPQAPAAKASKPAEKSGAAPTLRVDTPQDDAFERQNQQALTLVRAMVNAAKCDGQISQSEQEAILNRLDNPPPEAIQFLREEFSKPCDVREFAWSVPVGMEQQVYSMSLIAIDVDSDREEKYLRELARGLRLTPEACEQIKERITGASTRLAAAR
jgi:uncharacterized membrane protein YebE (DUF533 family)